ncbi:MAG: hypothetical protein HYU56_03740 [Candidatus Aenigmarchaeota archaeon]|nr:hypothetical protein [Candidatus Aenigmarchaeota archaeon]
MSKAEAADVPYFIQVRGCINCSASKEHKKRFGEFYQEIGVPVDSFIGQMAAGK